VLGDALCVVAGTSEPGRRRPHENRTSEARVNTAALTGRMARVWRRIGSAGPLPGRERSILLIPMLKRRALRSI
jgi:hypothetical protein